MPFARLCSTLSVSSLCTRCQTGSGPCGSGDTHPTATKPTAAAPLPCCTGCCIGSASAARRTCGHGWSPPWHTTQMSWRPASSTDTGQKTSEPLRAAASENSCTHAPPKSGVRARSTLRRRHYSARYGQECKECVRPWVEDVARARAQEQGLELQGDTIPWR